MHCRRTSKKRCLRPKPPISRNGSKPSACRLCRNKEDEMHIVSNNYTSFSLVVSLIICISANCTLVQVIRRRSYTQLNWLVPIAAGYTFAVVGGLLYACNPRYWFNLARSGSSPLLDVGIIAGLLMAYGWICFAATFFRHQQREDAPPMLVSGGAEQGVWPPPPTQPETQATSKMD